MFPPPQLVFWIGHNLCGGDSASKLESVLWPDFACQWLRLGLCVGFLERSSSSSGTSSNSNVLATAAAAKGAVE